MRRVFTILYLSAIAVLLVSCGAETAMKKGDKFYALGEYYDAANQYKKAYSQTKTKDRSLRGQRALKMADCYQRINYTQRAIAAYNNAVRYKQADSTALFRLAQMQLKNGNYRDAEKTFTLLLDSMPYNPLAKTGLPPSPAIPSRSKTSSTRAGLSIRPC